ncbi:CCA tRNA nucleotidyltransferase [Bacillus sp. JCM 19034]|uniref:CCA tRNA nucleotidyltransferase n=1 Tax=Bacillus sp. JCM 19034 TaxID=1481928 RepID=UPI000782173A|nr:CCA tRNA nucleotidyltransferase [Bacillus sp. JCM 19034]
MNNCYIDQVLHLLHVFNDQGYKAYIVGGAVRDFLLEKDCSDIDIVTTASPEQISTLFNKSFQMNTEHQTVIVHYDQLQLEVTTMRGDSIEEDLRKRDLTINSMAMDVSRDIIDPFGGQADLKQRLLRSLQPDQRFEEDPLRMLRVIRFVSELGYNVEQASKQVIAQKASMLRSVAPERLSKEWLKLLKGHYVKFAIDLLLDTKLYKDIPILQLTSNELEKLRSILLENQMSDVLIWTTFCLVYSPPKSQFLINMAVPTAIRRQVKTRLDWFKMRVNNTWNREMLFDATLEVALDVEYVRKKFQYTFINSDELKEKWLELPIHSRSELAITGHDLLKIGKKAGSWISSALREAEIAVIKGTCKNEKMSY